MSDSLRSLALPADLAGLVPFTYAYRYAHNDSFVIRFSHGQEINGGRPVEAIPLYTAEQLQSATASAITALSARVAELEAELATAARAMEADPDSCISLIGRLHKQIDAAEAQASLARRLALEETLCACETVYDRHAAAAKVTPEFAWKASADHCCDAIRALSPTLDMDALTARAIEAAQSAYSGAPDSHSQNAANVARAVLSALLEGGE